MLTTAFSIQLAAAISKGHTNPLNAEIQGMYIKISQWVTVFRD